MHATYSVTHLADSTLIQEIITLAAQDCSTTAALLARIMEFDARRLYLPAGYPSTFAWCVGELHLSEDATAKRIHAGRAARRFPVLFELLASGELHLTAIRLLAPHLTQANARELIAAARHQSQSAIVEMLAARFPRPDVPDSVRAMSVHAAPSPTPDDPAPLHLSSQHAARHVVIDNALPEGSLEFAGETTPVSCPIDGRASTPTATPTDAARCDERPTACALPPEPRARTMPLSADRFALQLTMSRATHDKLRHAQELLGHTVRQGDLETVLDHALDELIARLERQKFAASDRPRRLRTGRPGDKNPRTIPAHVKRAVWKRDRGQCTFVSASGHRCGSRRQLEFDHIVPIARGGQSSISNLRLRCRAHNQYEAELAFGAGFMNARRGRAQGMVDSARGLAVAAADASRSKEARATAQSGTSCIT